MPTIFREGGFRFFFYSNEGTPREQVDVYVEKDNFEAKFWVRPEIRVAYNEWLRCPDPFVSCWGSLRLIGTESRGRGMSSSVSAVRVRFDADSMWVDLSDGRTLGVPLAWFPRLLHASQDELNRARISSRGLHWDSLDEDISIAALLGGLGDQGARDKTFAA